MQNSRAPAVRARAIDYRRLARVSRAFRTYPRSRIPNENRKSPARWEIHAAREMRAVHAHIESPSLIGGSKTTVSSFRTSARAFFSPILPPSRMEGRHHRRGLIVRLIARPREFLREHAFLSRPSLTVARKVPCEKFTLEAGGHQGRAGTSLPAPFASRLFLTGLHRAHGFPRRGYIPTGGVACNIHTVSAAKSQFSRDE